MKFGAEAAIQFHLKDHHSKRTVQNAIDRVEYSFGHCYMAGALRTAHKEMFTHANGAREGSRKVLLVLGRAIIDSKQNEIMDEVRRLENSGIHLTSMVVDGDDEGTSIMSKMATDQKGFWVIEYFNQLTRYYMEFLRFVFNGRRIMICKLFKWL